MILVNSCGFTLYAFTRDARDKDVCPTISGCTAFRAPVHVGGRPTAGAGVRSSLLGTVSLLGNTKQVSYGGHSPYTYTAPSGPAQISHINVSQFGRRWPALNAAGQDHIELAVNSCAVLSAPGPDARLTARAVSR
jgi:hypothetical protein